MQPSVHAHWIAFLFPLLPHPSPAATTQPHAAAIREVQSGHRTVAEAHWWGFNPVDATAALQSAIRSGAKPVVVRRMTAPWTVDEIELASHQELIFEPGVVVQAKPGAFHGSNDSLFTADRASA